MDERFIKDYVCSVFTADTKVNPKQLRLIASGKRTPSNLYLTEKNELYALFLSPLERLNELQWENLLLELESEGFLASTDKSWSLSTEGSKLKAHFLSKYPVTSSAPTLRYALTRKTNWKRFLFVSQIFSEMSYHNSQYLPVISDPLTQKHVKKWLSLQRRGSTDLSRQWGEELILFLSKQTDDIIHLLLDQLTGHTAEALTQRQLSEKYGMPYLAVELLNLHFMESIQTFKEELPLIYSLWKQTDELSYSGTSESTHKSIRYFHQHLPLHNIAAIRKRKINTIKEHLLEYVMVSHWDDYSPYIPSNVTVRLHQLFEQNPKLSFKEANAQMKGLDFFWFRLIEIERMRARRCQRQEDSRQKSF
ncbi:hypothetical protein ADIAL_0321 [Alkalibacterium sp. AK22]|uniref:helix-turn-helix domain-containing protein n=1 Tax=Alkalibacterium sp. AK22 TaxID=1229520 RepID=UPI00044C11A5|nr:helix-turn-helix domain-containing protein [Alkalibacterium sp. AK22]EXJ24190.1 hypothetical protein ADIAL_0321 [Alkalibacterium sp. AK22]